MKDGELVKISNGRNYIVVYKLESKNKDYVLLISIDAPLDIKIGTIKQDGSNYILDLVKSREEAQYVLDSFTYQSST